MDRRLKRSMVLISTVCVALIVVAAALDWRRRVRAEESLALYNRVRAQELERDHATPSAMASPTPSTQLPRYTVERTPLHAGATRLAVQLELTVLSGAECRTIIDQFRDWGVTRGQLVVSKRSRKDGRTVIPVCVDNLDGRGLQINDWAVDL